MSRNECDAIRPLISAALDGDLDEHEFVQLSEHLASCPDCRQVHQDYFALRDDLRSTPPPAPPPQLARDVWKETVEKPEPPAIVRLFNRTSVRFGMSTMAASVVAILAVVLFIAHGYDQRSVPTVASSQPEIGSTSEWPVSRPIEIEFSKQMNQKSVEENLRIWPGSEQDRLPTSWSGNTLIIGRSPEQSVLLRPETDYRITILEHARDRHGNAIGDFWVLQFRTGAPDVAISTPSPDSNVPREDQRLDPESSSSWMFGQGSDDDEPDPPSPDAADEPETEAQAPADEREEQSSDESQQSQQQERAQPQEQQEQQEQPEPTPEPDPEPTQPEPTSEPEPDPTATPRPDPTPEPTATPSPDPTQTPEPYPVRGAFGDVYWGDSTVRDALGTPVQQARTLTGSEQEFQRGLMFRQHGPSRNAILVFINGEPVRTFNHDYDPNVHDFPVEEMGDGLYQPGGAFGKVWSENSSLAQQIGYSVSSEPVEGFEAAIQQFRDGALLYSRGSVYVLFGDGSWDVLTVRADSSGGFQGSDPENESHSPQEPEPDGDSESADPPSGDESTEAGEDGDDSNANEQTDSP